MKDVFFENIILLVHHICLPKLHVCDSMELRALLERSPVVKPLKNFPEFYETRRFITAFTRVLHWSLSWAKSIQSTPTQPTYPGFILILFSNPRLGLHSGLSSSGFPTNNLCAFFISPIHTTCPTHITLLDLIILITLCEEYKLWNSSLCSFLPPSRNFIPLRPKCSPQHYILRYVYIIIYYIMYNIYIC
jgi:hypothetical protein